MVACLFAFFMGGWLWQSECRKVEHSWDARPLLYTGTIETVPVKKGKTWRAEVTVRQHRILLYWVPDSIRPVPQCGDKIAFHAQIRRPSGDAFFSNFNYGRYLKHQGISGTAIAFAGKICPIGKEAGFSLERWAHAWRERVIDLYRDFGFEDDELAVVSALTVGDKSAITPELRAVYSATGASHVLSLSGMHIAMLAAILMLLFRPLCRLKGGKKLRTLLVLAALWFFAILSGLSAPVIRATCMFTLYVAGTFFAGKRMSGLSVWILTAFLMLVYNPFYLFDIGFQLSFTAVAFILLCYAPLSRCLPIRNRVLRYFWEVTALSVVAQLGTSPFILLYFGTFPTYFLLANWLVAPLSFLIMAAAVAFLALFAIPSIGPLAAQALHFLIRCLNHSMEWIGHLKGAQITSVYLNELQVLLCFFLIGSSICFIHQRRVRPLCATLACLILLAGSHLYNQWTPRRPQLCFTRSEVYTKHRSVITQLQGKSGLYRVDTLHLGLLKDGQWQRKHADGARLSLHYAYICRGFKGNLSMLSGLFEMRTVVFDASLAESYRERLVEECRKLKIPYILLPADGCYSITL